MNQKTAFKHFLFRISGILLALVLFLDMKLIVRAQTCNYTLGYSDFFYRPGGVVEADHILNANDTIDIQVNLDYLQTNSIYINGSLFVQSSSPGVGGGIMFTQPRNIPSTSDKYTYTLERDGVNLTLYLFSYNVPPDQTAAYTVSHSHTHSYSWVTVTEPTETEDGVEVYTCSCGDTKARNTLPACSVKWQNTLINLQNGKPGDTIIMEMGLQNTFSRAMMEELAKKRDVDIIITFTQNNKHYKITIPRGTAIDTSEDWYGPDKLKALFGYEEL